nr:MAG TPA: hypothetical protein [Caudoviricetes sp.]
MDQITNYHFCMNLWQISMKFPFYSILCQDQFLMHLSLSTIILIHLLLNILQINYRNY